MLHPYLGKGELTPVGTPEAAKYIRKAISHVLNRSLIVQVCNDYVSVPAITTQPYDSIGFDQGLEPYVYDVSLAQEYMEKAGFDLIKETPTTKTSLISFSLLVFLGLAYIAQRRMK